MDYRYLALLIPGFLMSVGGFVLLGRKLHPAVAGAVFLVGTIALVLGILLTCVPGFFSG